MDKKPAKLILENGQIFNGFSLGYVGDSLGEVCFNTGMTGYQEILTDPSYCQQLIAMTYPHIGNYGTNSTDTESNQIYASGFIVKLGTEDTHWNLGDEVVTNCNWHRNDDIDIYNDSMISKEQKIWGYETNFGSLAAFAVVKIHQLMTKPTHLSWSESCSYGLVFCTAYRMLLSDNGYRIKTGDKVLIWGGAGGLGLSAIQICNLIGAKAIPVVSDEQKGKFLQEKLGVEGYINRSDKSLQFMKEGEHNPVAWRKLQSILKKEFGGPVDVVFEHPGKETMAASIYVLRKGGKVVSCAATSGYDISYDHRYLWMDSKSIIGCHFANPYESMKANDLVITKKINPFVSSVHSFEDTDQALERFVKNSGFGKVVVSVLAKDDDVTSTYNIFGALR